MADNALGDFFITDADDEPLNPDAIVIPPVGGPATRLTLPLGARPRTASSTCREASR